MAFMLYSIEDAVDHKYVVNKTVRGQVKKGTLIHVMDARETSDGISVAYRVTKTKQDFIANFESVKQFCKWCLPSTFLAKYYDKLSTREILRYIKFENRTFLTFHLPVILVCLAVVWAASMMAVALGIIELVPGLILAGALSVVSVVGVFVISHFAKESMTERLYQKVSTKY